MISYEHHCDVRNKVEFVSTELSDLFGFPRERQVVQVWEESLGSESEGAFGGEIISWFWCACAWNKGSLHSNPCQRWLNFFYI